MSARENELADRLDLRIMKLEARASEGLNATFTPELLRQWAQQDRLAASTLRANAERIKALEEALDWALAEIDGRTVYKATSQRPACLERARAARSNPNV